MLNNTTTGGESEVASGSIWDFSTDFFSGIEVGTDKQAVTESKFSSTSFSNYIFASSLSKRS